MADLWRRALSGLTPRVVAIIVALLILRIVDTTIDRLLVFPETYGAGWLAALLENSRPLVLQVLPMILVIIATGNLGPQGGPKRIAALTAAVVVSAGLGGFLRIAFGASFHGDLDAALSMLSYTWPRYALLAGLLTIVAELYRSEMLSNKAAQQAELDRVSLEAEMSEARLQALQAQIEPHFLFNTLANARRLYAEDHALGRTMLESLMRYLEAALPEMRNSETTLARETGLVDAYLNIQRIRMGSRLAFTIDVPFELRPLSVPPMMVLTLVENAIKHGLGPSTDGGIIRVAARANGDRLEITVADTGVGFGSALGSGVGLANISARLAAEFGANARLALANNELGGATATILLPLARAHGTTHSPALLAPAAPVVQSAAIPDAARYR